MSSLMKPYKELVNEHIPEISDDQILCEPVGRNTAPCIAYAAYKIYKKDPNAVLMIAAADHLIMNVSSFLENMNLGMQTAEGSDVIVTIGIQPTRPDTGYGYIQYFEEEEDGHHKVKTFLEKPELEQAKTFLASGDFLWNSGMFIFSAKTILGSFREHMPDMAELFQSITEDYYTDHEKDRIAEVYSKCRNESIDYGIMQKATNVFVIRSTFDWSDLGTWGSLYEHKDKSESGDTTHPQLMTYDTEGNMIHIKDQDKLVVLSGMKDFIVVDTDDVLLVCPLKDEQKIKQIVGDVRD